MVSRRVRWVVILCLLGLLSSTLVVAPASAQDDDPPVGVDGSLPWPEGLSDEELAKLAEEAGFGEPAEDRDLSAEEIRSLEQQAAEVEAGQPLLFEGQGDLEERLRGEFGDSVNEIQVADERGAVFEPRVPAPPALPDPGVDPYVGQERGLGIAAGRVEVEARSAGLPGLALGLSDVEGGAGDTIGLEGLPVELADQLSPFGVAAVIDFDAAARGGVSKFVATLDLSDVPISDGASVWSRMRLVWLTDCRIVGDAVACGGSEVVDAEVDQVARVVSAEIDVEKLAAEAERKRQVLIDGGEDEASLSGLRRAEVREERIQAAMDAGLAPEPAQARDSAVDGEAAASQGVSTSPSLALIAPGAGFSGLALASGAFGSTGNFGATPSALLESFQVSGFTGSFDMSYPIDVPAAAAGPQPSVSLLYSSGSIDGMSSASNNQPGPVGVGWSLAAGGSITEYWSLCRETYAGAPVLDEPCIGANNTERYFTLTLNGVSSLLVEQSPGIYRLQDDPYWKVELRSTSGSTNKDEDNEWWRVTTKDGTIYRFGYKDESADWRQVYYPAGSGWPSRPTGCVAPGVQNPTNSCKQVYQWNLDRILDTNSNYVRFNRAQELNDIDYMGGGRWSYVRASRLESIEYTARSANGDANARVKFNWDVRCGQTDGGFSDCQFNGFWFPDTPLDLWCDPEAPTCVGLHEVASFWSQLKLGSIQTQVRRSGSGPAATWSTQMTYDLIQGFPVPPDSSERKLTLLRVQRRPGGDYEHWGFGYIQAEDYDDWSNLNLGDTVDIGDGEWIGGFNNPSNNEYLFFDDVYMGDVTGPGEQATQMFIRVRTGTAATTLRLRRDSANGAVLATINVPDTNQAWQTLGPITVSNLSGNIQDLYLETDAGSGSGIVRVNWFTFRPASYLLLGGLRSTTFSPTYDFANEFAWLRNRVNDPGGGQWMTMPRIETVLNEFGGRTQLTYGQTRPCTQGTVYNFFTFINAGRDCFGGPSGIPGNPGVIVFNKWKVLEQRNFDDFDINPATKDSANNGTVIDYDYGLPSWSNPQTGWVSCGSTFVSEFRGHRWVETTVEETIGNPLGATTGMQLSRTRTTFFQGRNESPTNCDGSTNVGSQNVSLWDGSPPDPPGNTIYPSGTTIVDRFQYRGRAVQTVVRNSGSTGWLTKTITQPTRTLTAGPGGSSLDGAWWTADNITTTYLVDGSTVTNTVTNLDYDAYGNVTRVRNLGLPGTGDDRYTHSAYVYNIGSWIVDRPQWVTQSTSLSNIAATRVSYQRFAYDGGAVGAAPTDGDLTRVEVVGSLGTPTKVTAIVNDAWGRPTSVSDGPGAATTTTYDATHGRVLRVGRPYNVDTVNTYDSRGRLATSADGNGDVTSFGYDNYSRAVTAWAPTEQGGSNPTQRYTYSSFWPSTVATEQLAASGNYIKTVDYLDGAARTVQTDRPFWRATEPGDTTNWDLYRRTVSIQSFNGAGQALASTASPWYGLGVVQSGLAIPNWGASIRWVENTYDTKGRLTSADLMAGSSSISSTTWTYRGYRTEVRDALNNRTDTTVDAFGNVDVVREYNGASIYSTTNYDYDAASRLTRVVDTVGNATDITYDLAGNKKTLNEPNSTGNWTYNYDAGHRLSSQTDPRGQSLYMTYDDLDRPRQTRSGSLSGPLLRQFTYDAPGELGLVNQAISYQSGAAAATWSYGYDDNGRAINKTLQIHSGPGANTFPLDFTYNPDSQVRTVTYPNVTGGTRGAVSNWYQSYSGLQTAATSNVGYWVDKTLYDWGDRVISQVTGSAANPASEYEATYSAYTDSLVDFKAKRSSQGWWDIAHTQYAYDANYNVTRVSDYRNPWIFGGQNLCFGYDNLDRLVDAKTNMNPATCASAASDTGTSTADVGTTYDRDYSYNQIGNLTNRNEAWGGTDNWTYTYGTAPNAPGPNAVTSITTPAGNHTFGYDAVGNQTSRNIAGQASQTLTYDEFNQLTSVTPAGAGGTQLYLYDAYGTRVRTYSNTTDYRVFVDKYYEGTAFPGLENTLNFYFGANQIGYTVGPLLSYLFSDNLGSAVASHQLWGDTFFWQRFMPYGDHRGNHTIPATNRDFTGQQRDTTNLLYYQSRYYDPLIGRFTQPDTIIPNPANPQDLNRYSYVRNNPLRYTDPSGNDPCPPSQGGGGGCFDANDVQYGRGCSPTGYTTCGDGPRVQPGTNLASDSCGLCDAVSDVSLAVADSAVSAYNSAAGDFVTQRVGESGKYFYERAKDDLRNPAQAVYDNLTLTAALGDLNAAFAISTGAVVDDFGGNCPKSAVCFSGGTSIAELGPNGRAFTLGTTIHVGRGDMDPALAAHEGQHVSDFQLFGGALFSAVYVGEWVGRVATPTDGGYNELFFEQRGTDAENRAGP